MAQLGAAHSVGESIVRYLRGAHTIEQERQAALPEDQRVLPDCRFEQVSGSQLASNFTPAETLVTLYLFRVGIDKNLRASPDVRFPQDPKSRPLSLELHYLITPWSGEAAEEQTLLSWVMLELHKRSLFDQSLLVPTRLWQSDEVIQVLPSEISHENMMRIWDALDPAYRLSVSYVARTVRVETGMHETAGPVVATRFQFKEHPETVDG